MGNHIFTLEIQTRKYTQWKQVFKSNDFDEVKAEAEKYGDFNIRYNVFRNMGVLAND